jgi:hypothetical protein
MGSRCLAVAIERVWVVGIGGGGVVLGFRGSGLPFLSAFQALIQISNSWRNITNS